MKLSQVLPFLLAAVSTALSFTQGSFAFSSSNNTGGLVHEEITREALKGIFSENNLKFLVDANNALDQSGSEAVSDLRRHFGDEKFSSSLAFLDRERKRALNYALESDTDPEQRGRALAHFAEVLHCVQDFYSRTNYIELMVAGNPGYKDDPYSLPLADWQKVPDAYPGLVNFSNKAANLPEKASIVKDSAGTECGKKIVSGKVTYFQVARDLAVRESQRQWNIFETMIRNRCGARAAAILAAIKAASPELKKENEKDELD